MEFQRHNNFNFLRFFLALGVILVHNGGVTGSDKLGFILQFINGDIIVECFFVISGYLITKSYLKKRDGYFYRRGLRLLPAYYACMIFMFVISAFISTYSFEKFILNHDIVKYVLANVFFINFIHPNLPGVFTFNPLSAINGSLWTLKTEIILYVSVPFYIFFFRYIKGYVFFITMIVSLAWIYYFKVVIATPASRTIAMQFVGMAAFFFGGALFSIYASLLKQLPKMTLASIVLYLIFKGTGFSVVVEWAVIVLMVLFFCLCLPLTFIKINNDYSYGMYIYNFPIIQILCSFGMYRTQPYLAFFMSILLTMIMSFFSWHYIEKRFLALKDKSNWN